MLYRKSLSNNLCALQKKDKYYLNMKKKDLNKKYIANKDQATDKIRLELSMYHNLGNPKPNFIQLLCLIDINVKYVFENCSESTKEDLY